MSQYNTGFSLVGTNWGPLPRHIKAGEEHDNVVLGQRAEQQNSFLQLSSVKE